MTERIENSITTDIEGFPRLTVDEYAQRFDGQSVEIINGEIRILPGNMLGHQEIARNFYNALLFFLATHPLGIVYYETVFVLPDTSNWVLGSRIPDVSFYEQARMDVNRQVVPNWRARPCVLVPDLVIEVVSPGDDLWDVFEKARLYLVDGVQVVWVAIPAKTGETHEVYVYEADGEVPTIIGMRGTLTCESLLPGFALPVAEIFA